MTSRPRIIFVDDETSVLSGLRRQLLDRRAAWDLAFVASAAEALALMEAQPADVVVSDMRMPGMDGAALLERVRLTWPATVRILLTGYTDQESTLRLARSAHQFLNKPCEPAALREALQRALDLAALVPDAGLRGELAQLVALPLSKLASQRIQLELDRPDASLRRLGAMVELDPGLSAKTLQLVNCAAMGLPQRIFRPSQAVALLGLDHVRSLWTALNLAQALGQRPGAALPEADLHAEALALELRAALAPNGEQAASLGFTAGLLHDLGEQALAFCRPQAWAQAQGQGLEAELQACGAGHAGVGAYLLGLWGLPAAVVDAVARHHQAPDDTAPLQAALAGAVARRQHSSAAVAA